MAMSTVARSGLRSALRCGGLTKSAPASAKRSFASSTHDDAQETEKWKKISILGIVFCTGFAAYNLSKGHPHYDTPPAYTYMHIRNKEFPWGPDGLFETKPHDH